MLTAWTRKVGSRVSFLWLVKFNMLDGKPQGVNLWNISGLVRKTPEDDARSLVAARKLSLTSAMELPWVYHGPKPSQACGVPSY